VGTLHIALGIAFLILVIVTTTVEFTRPDGAPRALRGATIGLLDIQILLGIAAWFTTHSHLRFILHPLLMLIGIIILHLLTGKNQSRSMRTMGWVIGDILLLIGALLYVV